MLTAVYPGTFDPITNGHLDIIERAVQIFDLIIVAVSENPAKEPLFTREERIGMIKEATAYLPRVKVEPFDGLLCDFARRQGAKVVVRGLRALSDFDYEFQMALMNKKLYPELETVFLVTNSAYSYLRSSVVREVAYFGGCVGDLVPENVDRKLRQKFAGAAKDRGGQVTEL